MQDSKIFLLKLNYSHPGGISLFEDFSKNLFYKRNLFITKASKYFELTILYDMSLPKSKLKKI